MNCKKCGNQVNSEAKFCKTCGAEIEAEEQTNDGKRCLHCKALLKDGALFCGECGNTVGLKKVKPVIRNQNKGLIFLVVLSVVAVIAIASVTEYIYLRNNLSDTKTADAEISTDDETEIFSGEDENETTEVMSATEGLEETKYVDDEFDIEEEVLRIRAMYNATQANLSILTKNSTEDGTVNYYDSDFKLVRMDISANSTTSYTKYCYFENGKLYFAFVFDGTKENRLYFKDDRLFRWIDEAGKIHDRERNNGMFLRWEEIVMNELNN